MTPERVAELRSMLTADDENREDASLADAVPELHDALARATTKRDEARRMYCERGSQPGLTPRMVADANWPAEADRLFPKEVDRE